MKKLLIVLIGCLSCPQTAFAVHHDVFISRIVKLSNTECAVEMEIFSNNQDQFDAADEIRKDSSTLVAFGSFASTLNSGNHNDGDKILAASSGFESFASVAGDLSFGNSECANFDANVNIAFYIAAGTPNCGGGTPCEVDTVESSQVSGWTGGNHEAIQSLSRNDDDSFVDLDCDEVSVTNNAGTSTLVGTVACGNASCDCGETNATCPADCPAVCGNGDCEPGENSSNCPDDCGGGGGGGGGLCGNGFCNSGENASNCPQDCSVGSVCGNDVCEGDETVTSCAEDCGGSGEICGNNICVDPETSATCPADCVTSSGSVCGDDVCDDDETVSSCVEDCAGSETVCGNGSCEVGETEASCAADCATNSGSSGGCSLIK